MCQIPTRRDAKKVLIDAKKSPGKKVLLFFFRTAAVRALFFLAFLVRGAFHCGFTFASRERKEKPRRVFLSSFLRVCESLFFSRIFSHDLKMDQDTRSSFFSGGGGECSREKKHERPPPQSVRKRSYVCNKCDTSFLNKFNFLRHCKTASCNKRSASSDLFCKVCRKSFARADNLKRHQALHHGDGASLLSFACGLCSKCFRSRRNLDEHRKSHIAHTDFQLCQSAHRHQAEMFRAHVPENVTTLDSALLLLYDDMVQLVRNLTVEFPYRKINFNMRVEMFKRGPNGEMTHLEVFSFPAFGIKMYYSTDIYDEVAKAQGDITRNVDEFLSRGSGWIILKPLTMEATSVRCQPLTGSSCHLHIAKWTRGQGIRPTSMSDADDGLCFYLAVAHHFVSAMPVTRRRRPSGNPYQAEKLFARENFRGLPSDDNPPPMAVQDIDHFEQTNAHLDLAINVVFQDYKGKVLPVRASRNLKAVNKILLILFHTSTRDAETEEVVHQTHYMYCATPHLLFKRRRGERKKKKKKKKGESHQEFLEPDDIDDGSEDEDEGEEDEKTRKKKFYYYNSFCYNCFNG